MSDTLNRRAPVGNTRSALALLGFLAACFAVAGLGSVITTAQTSPGGWFETLEKPFFSPPSWLFGPVWTISISSSPCRDGSCGAGVGSPALE